MRRVLVLLFSLFSSFNYACDLGEIKFDNSFPGASADKMIASCKLDNTGHYAKIVLKPENTPINDSAWYAFKLSSSSKKQLNIAIEVKGGTNRYPPKVSYDGKLWQYIEHTFDEEQLQFSVQLSTKPVIVAAQEMITNEDYIKWGKKAAQKSFVEKYKVANSVNMKPIYAYDVVQNPDVNKWLVVLGRMHPPELTGAMAFFPFADTLLGDSKLAYQFRDKFNVLIVPNINPDGVEAGHWRHNVNGIDLNRDWINFSQPEVIGVHKRIQQLVKEGGKMAMAVDFHSTNKDVFYVMPTDYDLAHPHMVESWLKSLDDVLNVDFTVLSEPGTSPGRGVFKQYFADEYKVHAITYEMGDNTNREVIDLVAEKAAETLMSTMLKVH